MAKQSKTNWQIRVVVPEIKRKLKAGKTQEALELFQEHKSFFPTIACLALEAAFKKAGIAVE